MKWMMSMKRAKLNKKKIRKKKCPCKSFGISSYFSRSLRHSIRILYSSQIIVSLFKSTRTACNVNSEGNVICQSHSKSLRECNVSPIIKSEGKKHVSSVVNSEGQQHVSPIEINA